MPAIATNFWSVLVYSHSVDQKGYHNIVQNIQILPTPALYLASHPFHTMCCRFSPYGAVLSVKVLHEEESKRCRGICFVNYTDLQGALNAIQHLNGRKVADKHLHVSLQKPRGRV